MRDMKEKKRSAQSKKTHCPKNHPYKDNNLIIGKDGKRYCLECREKNGKEYRKLNKEKIRNYKKGWDQRKKLKNKDKVC